MERGVHWQQLLIFLLTIVAMVAIADNYRYIVLIVWIWTYAHMTTAGSAKAAGFSKTALCR